MIVAKQKPFETIYGMVAPNKRIMLAGCGSCVTVCFAGGEKEVGILASLLRMRAQKDRKDLDVVEATIKRQCDVEFIDELKPKLDGVEAILSIGCGAGVQYIAERFGKTIVLPGLDTTFLGVTEAMGVWTERCQGCGDCKLHLTAGVCPIARCSKSLLNGPCGGSMNGKCEVSADTPCGWQLIVDRMEALGILDRYEQITPANDWTASRDGGPRRIDREDLHEIK
ncbi:MAG: methylenetetrahydrofolate reductase C-terminal domain-containing protein [Deltaproteobacteria bacterium]|nr:methylenetetrahydrofolate reductase C-terminal domain-containing protein [Deltaproteobacteria bacterium]